MADKRDYYDILGVDKDADEGELKSAYRKLAMKFHPDRNPDDKEAEKNFKELNEAYEVLKDGEKRAAYDRFGHAAFEGGMGGGGGGPRPGAGGPQGDFASAFSTQWTTTLARRLASGTRRAGAFGS